ncbi:protein roadkill-like [Aphidius gifuensis]|uniref:protein roadkill-like n=1 Tax=Aphidius gifuensis TaxID=684658 RepID=UPI001CDBDDF8|nr:protein roadkill-like [Aphidius gifuensis]
MSVLAGSITQASIKLITSKQDSVTGMECCEFKYVWTIKNFSQWAEKIIKSPSFSSNYGDIDDKWILGIYSDIMPKDGDTCILAALQLQSVNKNSQPSQLQIRYKITVNDQNERAKKCNFTIFPKTTKWNSWTNKINLSNPSQYLPNGDLKICCTITLSRTPKNDYSDIISTFNATPKLSVDWKKLLLSEKSADVTIKVGQKSFRAIKGILAIRSPVFAAMFDHEEFKENEKNEIDCLKNICEEAICKTINVDNVASIFICSDRYNLKKLNQKCFEFMKKNLRDVMSNITFQVYKKKYPEIFVGALEELLLSADLVNYTID